MEDKHTQRLEEIKEKGWMTQDGSPGPNDPLKDLQNTRDPFKVALAVAAGLPMSKVLEAFPIQVEKVGFSLDTYSGQIVAAELPNSGRSQYFIETERGKLPLPITNTSVRNELDANKESLGIGSIKRDTDGVYIASLEIGSQQINFGRDGREVDRTPLPDLDF